MARKLVLDELIREVSWRSTLPSASVTCPKLWIDSLMSRCRWASRVVKALVSRFSGANRLKIPRRSATLVGLAASTFGLLWKA